MTILKRETAVVVPENGEKGRSRLGTWSISNYSLWFAEVSLGAKAGAVCARRVVWRDDDWYERLTKSRGLRYRGGKVGIWEDGRWCGAQWWAREEKERLLPLDESMSIWSSRLRLCAGGTSQCRVDYGRQTNLATRVVAGLVIVLVLVVFILA